ncbi:MAG: alpha-mannosidase [Candidatus Hodarchaeota archaeon]
MKRLFHETSDIGHYSGSKREIEADYERRDEGFQQDDLLKWIEHGKQPNFQKIIREKWEKLFDSIEKGGVNPANNIHVGQSHIDVAWLWRYIQTTEKARITFSKACTHVEKIPEFTFTASQSVLFDWCRIKHPDLFDRIKNAVKTGRFELVGGSWCEPDGHMPSGEAWARQKLYGQLFLQKHFGCIADIEWLPDAFGFTSSIPQILAKSGYKRFLTLKLSWNDTNRFPFRTFWWQSQDGSKVLADCRTGGENRIPNTRNLLKNSKNPFVFNYETPESGYAEYFSPDENPYTIQLYGKGDGGHGPTGREVQERLYLHRQGALTLGTAMSYFEAVERDCSNRLPTWQDELYFEYHRGTLTTHGLVKRMNRYNEWMLPSIEALCVHASLNSSFEYPHESIDESWKMTLMQQFHDVLPGTCISELYDESWDIWCWQVKEHEKIIHDAFSSIMSGLIKQPEGIDADNEDLIPVLLFNPTSFKQETIVEIPVNKFESSTPKSGFTADGKPLRVSLLPAISCPGEPLYELPERISFPLAIESLGFGTVYLTSALPSNSEQSSISYEETDESIQIGNEHIQASFHKSTGSLVSLKFRKSSDAAWKESLLEGEIQFHPDSAILEPGINLHAFKENPKDFPAWNLWKPSRQNPFTSKLLSIQVSEKGENHATVDARFEIKSEDPIHLGEWETSQVSCQYTVFQGDPMLYLTMVITLNGRRILLKLDIPTATGARKIDAEVAYGIDTRSTVPTTKWDKARWENVMHTWVNMQSPDDSWGFAIINEGKYGVDYHGGNMGVSILKGQSYHPAAPESWVYEERFDREDEGRGRPPSWIDLGTHVFRLALYPHVNGYREAGVIERAHLFNSRPIPFVAGKEGGEGESATSSTVKYSLPKCTPPLEITSIKAPHEDGDAVGFDGKQIIILHVHNTSCETLEGEIDVSGLQVIEARECDLLERQVQGKLKISSTNGKVGVISATWNPFEVKAFGLHVQTKMACLPLQ